MKKSKWTMCVGILGVSVGLSACRDANKDGPGTTSAASGTTASAPAAGGDHSNEEFCKAIVAQFEQMKKFDPSDAAKRQKYFAEQKDMNAKLVKLAPPPIASDVTFQTNTANAAIDAQLARDPARVQAAAAGLSSPAYLAAAKRINEYCGIKTPAH